MSNESYVSSFSITQDSLNFGSQNIFIPDITCLKYEEPCFGMQGWISIKTKDESVTIYFHEDKEVEMSFLFNKLSQKTNKV